MRVSVLGHFLILLLSQKQLSQAAGSFIRTNGFHFMLDGNPFFANGFNAYWLMNTASDPSQRDKVSSAFKEASINGLTVARTWAFNDGGGNALQYSPGSYNEQVFEVLISEPPISSFVIHCLNLFSMGSLYIYTLYLRCF